MFRLDRDGKLWIVYLASPTTNLELFGDGEETGRLRQVVGPNHFISAS
jgi:hypothetical protein